MDYFDLDDGLKVDQAKHDHSTNSTNIGGSNNGFIDGSVQFIKLGQRIRPGDSLVYNSLLAHQQTVTRSVTAGSNPQPPSP